jgi:exopolyphosphatase/guanosine-5'-triphosphate,3'-diphosphate pyrophosphatase
VVALVTRYHRRGGPKQSHPEYTAMPRERRVEVSKLAALLRVADALDRGHAQHVQDFHVERHGEEVVLLIHGVSDLALERLAMEKKADLFENIYGLRVRLEEAPLPLGPKKGTGPKVQASPRGAAR